MGLKKSSRRLLKLGRQAAREMGEGGRDFVDTVFRTATQVLEEAIRRGASKVSPRLAASKRSQTTASTRGRRPGARTKAGKARSLPSKKAPAPSRHHAVQRSRASRAAHASAKTASRPRERKSSSAAPSQRSARRPRALRPPRTAPGIQEHFESPAPAVTESAVTAPADGSLV